MYKLTSEPTLVLLSDKNIGVESDGNGTLNVKLAKDLKGLDSADIGGVTINNKGIDMGIRKLLA